MPNYPIYGYLVSKGLKNKSFMQMKHDLEIQSSNISSYVSELASVIKTGTIPTAPGGLSYTPTPEEPILFLKDKQLETTVDVANDDTMQLLFQENTMYIMGTITCATLIISAIFFAKDK